MEKKVLKKQASKAQLDVSGYDRSTIIWRVRGAYRKGCDEIEVKFSNTETAHLRKDDKISVRDVVRDQAHRLIGMQMEVIDAHTIMLRTQVQPGDIDEIIRRVLERMASMYGEFLLLTKGHLYAASLIEEKHDSTTKLITYCQLLLSGTQHSSDDATKFHLIADVDKIADIIKYMARDYSRATRPMSKTTAELLASVGECIALFERVHKKYSAADVTAFSLKRDDVKRQMRTSIPHLDPLEAFLVGQATCILEILIDMMEYSMQLQPASGKG